MATSELPAFFERLARTPGEFLVYDDGFRGWTFSYSQLGRLARMFSSRLRAAGIGHGDTILIWSESRPGWIAALWGCLLQGVIVVPLEPQSSPELLRKIHDKVKARLLVTGERVPAMPEGMHLPVWRMPEIEQPVSGDEATAADVSPDDPAEIVFTSGTTAEPKGVVITHRNLAAQLSLDSAIAPYRRYVKFFAPVRILNLLPMSHLFGQSLATFIPPLIPASVVLISTTNPAEIVRQVHARNIVALVSVPKVLELLRDYVIHRFPRINFAPAQPEAPWWKRWWKYRAVHRMFGWRFCCFVSGGAPLPPDIEAFWSEMAFVIVQGYGLTETAPIISFSHPFHPRRGATGKPVRGVDVKLAEDGEVLVRGANVTPGYFGAPDQTSGAFVDGWLRTGDLGEFDAQGNLVIRGRKKEVIVTPEGLKVFPEDVEAKLNAIPGVRESAVIGHDRVHAVVVLEPDAPSADEIVRQANLTLEEHQKIRDVTVWTGGPLPRTKTTLKLRRGEIAEAIGHGSTQARAAPESELAGLVAKYAPGRRIQADTSLAELGLSSLDRVGLMMDLEAKLNTSFEETAFASAKTVGDLAKPAPAPPKISFPAWNRKLPARLFRAASLEFLLPLASLFAWRKVSGRENLGDLKGPVIFAANHQSLLDTPVILASLPRPWRRRVAPAMLLEFFAARFHPEGHSWYERFRDNSLYWLAALFFNAYPIPQTERALRDSIRYSGELAEEGWSILIHPEGARSRSDQLLPLYSGTAVLASHLHLPVVPIRLRGVNRVLSPDKKWPVPGPVRVAFGSPITMGRESVAEFTHRLEEALRAL